MKKIIFAAFSAASCTLVSAQSNVTLYGIVDQYVDRTDAGGRSATRLQSGGIAGSRLGFRGREDLGGGYAAFFQLESGINADDGTLGQGGLIFGRQAFVGLSTPYGDVSFGRQYVPHFYSIINYALNGGLSFGVAANYYSDATIMRVNNSIFYNSKSWNGLSVQGMYAFGENAQSKTVGNVASAAVAYSNGPFNAGAAYTQRKTADNNTDRYIHVGATYDFKVVKLGFLANSRRDDIHVNKSNLYDLSLTIPVSTTSSLALDFGRLRNRAVADGSSTSLSARYDYFLSKRTTLYGGVAKIRNGSAASFGINGATGAALPVTVGQDPRTLVAGIRHSF